jgi:hydroxymethylpyrimidine pyrophosphatase-like HAD family hydrolase
MGQASETVKSAARAITASNREEGVAQAIQRYAFRDATTADSNSLKRLTCP